MLGIWEAAHVRSDFRHQDVHHMPTPTSELFTPTYSLLTGEQMPKRLLFQVLDGTLLSLKQTE
jgi:hypothetical protein